MLKFGNHKLGDDIAIFNMGTAKNCPARKLGLCETVNRNIRCYAEKAEIQYPKTVPSARRKQRHIWKTTPAHELLQQYKQKIDRRKKATRYLRFNESGDFYDQSDVEKLSYIAAGLKTMGVTTYGYTARSDLDFSNVHFLVKGSGHSNGNNGKTTVITAEEQVLKGYIECPGSCKRCNLCKINVPHNIAFRKH